LQINIFLWKFVLMEIIFNFANVNKVKPNFL